MFEEDTGSLVYLISSRHSIPAIPSRCGFGGIGFNSGPAHINQQGACQTTHPQVMHTDVIACFFNPLSHVNVDKYKNRLRQHDCDSWSRCLYLSLLGERRVSHDRLINHSCFLALANNSLFFSSLSIFCPFTTSAKTSKMALRSESQLLASVKRYRHRSVSFRCPADLKTVSLPPLNTQILRSPAAATPTRSTRRLCAPAVASSKERKVLLLDGKTVTYGMFHKIIQLRVS
jgi:hypothetical protein